ncbi:MAG TPA: SigE family RNA polymerase sigma factor [Mycobacteriales bacterium]|nr:SigE family RNA polymerase sigma factor [Mycobacteriales bacterium]
MSEPDGFRDFVAARSRSLLRTAWLLTGDWPTAEDLVQTALAKTWLRWGSIRRREDPAAYVRRAMVNTYSTWWRRRWTGEIPTAAPPEGRVRDDPFAAVDTRGSLLAALEQLPRRQRAVVVLRFYDDFTEAQVAAMLGCSVGTVKSQTAKALAKLRAFLVDEEVAR